MKDTARRFVWMNQPLARLLGYGSESELIGLRDEDISPEYVTAHYRRDDEDILRNGKRLIDAVELVRGERGNYDWFLSTKLPVRDEHHGIIGLVGATRTMARRDTPGHSPSRFAPAVELIAEEYHRPLSVSDIAATVSMSPSHFSRLFSGHFQVSPHKYLQRVRLMVACELLCTTELTLSEVAAQAGFYDQSHLANTIAKERGMSPGVYRKQFGGPRRPETGAHRALARSRGYLSRVHAG